jgi:Cohesin domain
MSVSRRSLTFLVVLLGIGALFFRGFPARSTAHAAGASLYLSPSSGTFTVGSIFTVSIYADTGGEAINAVQADLSFPPSKLQVVSPSSGKSFFQTWVIQPTYSNTMGTLNFSGAIPNPGIVTSAGLISTITFRVMDTGAATVKFLDSSRVLLNDGQGTDVLSQTSDGIYTLTTPPPAGPIVTSPTNPDQSQWYNSSQVVLQWAGEPDVTGYSYMVSDLPVDTPNDVSNGSSTSATYENLADGVHYFHIKALAAGKWGGVTNFAVRVDNTPPAAFSINVSPTDYTSDQNPIIQFSTTDAASGIDHYEIKIIPLDLGAAQTSNNETPFFVETNSPYLQYFPLGRYTIVVRAYDAAGNYYQATDNLSIVSPFFKVVGSDGVQIGGLFVLGWPYVFGLVALLLLLLGFGLAKVLRHHRDIEARLAKGAAANPEIAAKLAELQQKRKDYEDALKRLTVFLLLAGSVFWLLGFTPRNAHAAGLTLNPPIINLYPSSLANDEVLYLGGWANVPNATVQIYIEQTETGNTYSGTATTGPDGNWFFSFPQLLDSGHYAAWAELAEGQTVSPPSARVNITVSPTAIQIGGARLDYAEFYFLLFLLFLAAAIVLLILMFVYSRRVRVKRSRLEAAIRAAEESLRRGFSLLQRDIEAELAGVQKLKLQGPFPEEEHAREEKLLKDLDAVKRYIGKEIWHIEEEEER